MFGNKKPETMREKVARLDKQAGDGFKVISGDEMPMILHVLLSAYFSVPDEARDYVDNELFEMMHTKFPRAMLLAATGEYLPTEFIATIAEEFVNAVDGDDVPEDFVPPSGSVMGSAVEIAEAIDKAVSIQRTVADQDDYFNHAAQLDIIAGHALITRGLNDLMSVPADYEGSSDADEAGTDC
jgi:hypothetical protein